MLEQHFGRLSVSLKRYLNLLAHFNIDPRRTHFLRSLLAMENKAVRAVVDASFWLVRGRHNRDCGACSSGYCS